MFQSNLLKILNQQKKAPAIAAGLLALLVNGLIIALGTGVEIRLQKKNIEIYINNRHKIN